MKLYLLTVCCIFLNCCTCLFSLGTTPSNTNTTEWVDPRSWHQEDFPNPRTMEGANVCSNGTERLLWVCDPGHFMTTAEMLTIHRTIERWHFAAECPCVNCNEVQGPFFQIMVAVISKINTTEPDSLTAIKHFSEYLRTNTWNYAACDDNIVIAISIKDQSIWTASGKTARELLTETCMTAIFEENKYLLASSIYSVALQNMVNEYILVLNGNRDCEETFPKWLKYTAFIVVSLLILLFFADRISYFIFRRPLFFCCQKKKVNPETPAQETVEAEETETDNNNDNSTSSHMYSTRSDESLFYSSSSPLSCVDSKHEYLSQDLRHNDTTESTLQEEYSPSDETSTQEDNLVEPMYMDRQPDVQYNEYMPYYYTIPGSTDNMYVTAPLSYTQAQMIPAFGMMETTTSSTAIDSETDINLCQRSAMTNDHKHDGPPR